MKNEENDLPDDIVYQILSKLTDLKTLCICKLVCKHFYRIVLQVKAISCTSVTHPLVDPRDMKLNISISVTLLRSFESVMLSLKKFTKVKFVRIQLTCPYDNPLLFKWKIKFGNKIDSFLFLSPNSIFHNQNLHVKENSHKEDMEMKNNIALVCWIDAVMSHLMLLCCIENILLLESIFITDSGKRRMISYSVGKFTQMRSCLTSPYETIKQKLSNGENVLRKVDQCYVPLLKLLISRYVKKGVTLISRERISLPDDISLLNTHMLDDEF
ncbi:F-box domain containing protein [Tanacetum coccineum]